MVFLKQIACGDRIWVDARALFMERRLLKEAIFVQWTDEKHPGWLNNQAIIITAPMPRMSRPWHRMPQVRPVYNDKGLWNGTYLVDTPYIFDSIHAEYDRKHGREPIPLNHLTYLLMRRMIDEHWRRR